MHLHLQRTGPEIDRLVATRFDGVLLNHALLVAGGEFLDVGCGLGDMVAAMQRAGMNARGIDQSPARWRSLSRWAEGSSLTTCSIEATPTPSSTRSPCTTRSSTRRSRF